MTSKVKNFLKPFVPPVLISILRRRNASYRYKGFYKTWEEASRVSSGYDAEEILTRVKDSLMKVKRGEAEFERDGVLFDRAEYSWPLLAGILWVAGRCSNELCVLDYGGSLGSTYFQIRKFLTWVKKLRWCVVEQQHFVDCGRELFEDKNLKFYSEFESCVEQEHPTVVVLSSVLSYLEKPYDVLGQVMNCQIEHIIIDRTPFVEGDSDRLTVQKVSSHIYRASYPCWIFGVGKFLRDVRNQYDVVAEFHSQIETSVYWKGVEIQSRGFFLKSKQSS